MRRIEVRGIDLALNEDALNDIEVADCLVTIERGDGIPPIKRVLVALFGEAQYKTIQAKCMDNGRWTLTDAAEFLAECFVAADQKK